MWKQWDPLREGSRQAGPSRWASTGVSHPVQAGWAEATAATPTLSCPYILDSLMLPGSALLELRMSMHLKEKNSIPEGGSQGWESMLGCQVQQMGA